VTNDRPRRKGEAYEDIRYKLDKWSEGGSRPRVFTQREFCEQTGTQNNTTTFRTLHQLCDVVRNDAPIFMPTKYRYPKDAARQDEQTGVAYVGQ
jgi:hypothetical protein